MKVSALKQAYNLLVDIHHLLKVSQCMRYGARVEKFGTDISEAKTHAMKMAKKDKLLYVNG